MNIYKEWYRGENWGSQDKTSFYEKLSRARETSRSQYLQIKAYHLIESKNKKLAKEAIVLLEKALKYPNAMTSVIYYFLGQAYRLLGDNKNAVKFYKKAIEEQNFKCQSYTQADTEYLALIIEDRAIESNTDILKIVNLQLKRDPLFLESAFMGHLAKAVIHDSKGEKLLAAREIEQAAKVYDSAEKSGGQIGNINFAKREKVIKFFRKLVKEYNIKF